MVVKPKKSRTTTTATITKWKGIVIWWRQLANKGDVELEQQQQYKKDNCDNGDGQTKEMENRNRNKNKKNKYDKDSHTKKNATSITNNNNLFRFDHLIYTELHIGFIQDSRTLFYQNYSTNSNIKQHLIHSIVSIW